MTSVIPDEIGCRNLQSLTPVKHGYYNEQAFCDYSQTITDYQLKAFKQRQLNDIMLGIEKLYLFNKSQLLSKKSVVFS